MKFTGGNKGLSTSRLLSVDDGGRPAERLFFSWWSAQISRNLPSKSTGTIYGSIERALRIFLTEEILADSSMKTDYARLAAPRS